MGPNADPRVNCCAFGQLLFQHAGIGLIDLFYSFLPFLLATPHDCARRGCHLPVGVIRVCGLMIKVEHITDDQGERNGIRRQAALD
mgnify:CR=1 FL=1